MMEMCFWILLGLVFYTYLGYPLLLFFLAKIYIKKVEKKEFLPLVSLIIAVYNEEKIIEDKINNCLELDYPRDKLEIIIGSDGSTDNTNESIEKYSHKGIKFFKWENRRGKVNVLNDLILQTKGEIIVFADSRQIFEKNALIELVNNFADEKIGCVSGELELLEKRNSSIGKGLELYWEYEKMVRKQESKIGSMIGATGAIYAIRKELYVNPPADTLLDDVFIPMKIVEQGYRAIFEPLAKAYDNVSQTFKEENTRKVRTLAGNWQIFFRLKNLFNPFKSKIAVQLFSHKVLRTLMPFFLIMVFVVNLFLSNVVFYRNFLILQMIFYLCALIGFLFSKYKIKFFSIPYTFCMLNIAAVKGLYLFVNKRHKVTWGKMEER